MGFITQQIFLSICLCISSIFTYMGLENGSYLGALGWLLTTLGLILTIAGY